MGAQVALVLQTTSATGSIFVDRPSGVIQAADPSLTGVVGKKLRPLLASLDARNLLVSLHKSDRASRDLARSYGTYLINAGDPKPGLRAFRHGSYAP